MILDMYQHKKSSENKLLITGTQLKHISLDKRLSISSANVWQEKVHFKHIIGTGHTTDMSYANCQELDHIRSVTIIFCIGVYVHDHQQQYNTNNKIHLIVHWHNQPNKKIYQV